jgi:hypothetical protein
MNTYTAKFWASCPVNGLPIDYTLTIKTGQQIRVESIQERLGQIKEGFHEEIADFLIRSIGGEQVLEAMHHGVHIKTERPMLPHWIKASEVPA